MISSKFSIKLLNHASALLKIDELTLLTDPWYEGTCFRGGWGLQYLNPQAFEDAVQSTHLWISHFHGDHLHLPTLRRIAERRPDLRAFANVSANFDMTRPLKEAGFKNITPLYERAPVQLSKDIRITRYPSTGIDNMLAVHGFGRTFLNFNDCNMPAAAMKAILKKIGPIDVLFTNFNHAYKLIDAPSDEEVKQTLRQRFLRIVETANPTWVVPFASMHYYRAKVTFGQNDSMLTSPDLVRLSSKTLALSIGDEVVFDKDFQPIFKRFEPPLLRSGPEIKEHKGSVGWPALLEAAEKFRKNICREFLGLTFWLRPLGILVEDLGRVLTVVPRKGIFEESDGKTADIAMHSEALLDWFTKPFGTDAFFVGADFRVTNPATTALHKLILAGEFVENGLAPRQVLQMLLTLKGFGFFWNRREEIWATLSQGRIKVGYRL